MLKQIVRSASVLLVSLIVASPALAADPSPKDAAAKAQAIIEKGLAYLKSQQKPDGGWQEKDDPPAVTAIVLRAFLQQPGNTSKTDFIAKGLQKLLSFQLPSGGIYQDLLANYNTSIAVSALAATND